MTTVQLVTATADDVDELLAMMEDFNALENIPWQPTTGRTPLLELLRRPELGAVLRLFVDERCLGYAVLTWGFDLEWNGRDAFMTELYFLPFARGKGFGLPAVAAVGEFAQSHGAGALHLMVRPENTAARKVYERAGFTSPPRIFLSKVLPRDAASVRH